jgi:hypothetical protein
VRSRGGTITSPVGSGVYCTGCTCGSGWAFPSNNPLAVAIKATLRAAAPRPHPCVSSHQLSPLPIQAPACSQPTQVHPLLRCAGCWPADPRSAPLPHGATNPDRRIHPLVLLSPSCTLEICSRLCNSPHSPTTYSGPSRNQGRFARRRQCL